ncbi:uncharacterized protein LOC143265192 [Megachile rotundata]|uniref:uncharacterized protein LOC143265192 n=1 Tax=Megachile rotundata TaxID=143995 RepID=UPI003FD1C20E
MTEVASESTVTDAINTKIMSILNPALHHHDLLQSYVRAPVEGPSSSKQTEEPENLNDQSPSLGICLATTSSEDVNKESQVSDKKRKKKNDKKEQKKDSNKTSVETEMKIQKKKK